MKRPSDQLQANQQEMNDLEAEMWRISFAYREMGIEEIAALDLAEAAVGLTLLENLKNELEDRL
jgi:hypothetical protein